MRVLLAGWFSFPGMGASAGDLMCRDLVREWLESAGMAVTVATATPFTDGVNWESLDPASVDGVVFVCGPFGNGWPIPEFLERFSGKRLVGINLSMLEDLETWNPFDALFERDSSRMERPDAVFLAPLRRAPVVGLVLVHPQKEYGERGLHERANQALQALAERRGAAIVPIDTRLDENRTGLTTPAQVDALIGRMDLILTTRLHGMVMALRNGVPPIAVDPIAGGAKILRQAKKIDWSHAYLVHTDLDLQLDEAWDRLFSQEGRAHAASTAQAARIMLAQLEPEFISAMDPQYDAAKGRG